MKLFRLTWSQCPHVHHTKQVAFVEANNMIDAKVILRDHIERHLGIEWFSIFDARDYTPPTALGRVLTPAELARAHIEASEHELDRQEKA